MGLDSVTKEIFQDNFYREFHKSIQDSKDANLISTITDFKHCNFSRIREWVLADRDRKKTMSREEKLAQREAAQKMEEPFRYCLIDGFREKVGSMMWTGGRGEEDVEKRMFSLAGVDSMLLLCSRSGGGGDNGSFFKGSGMSSSAGGAGGSIGWRLGFVGRILCAVGC